MAGQTIFVSYSHKDEVEKKSLLDHLGVLQRNGIVLTWSDDRISPGDEWERKIHEAMSHASVAIFLITVNFLNSNYILTQEIPVLLRRRESSGLIIFPVIARACAWREQDWLVRLNVWPKNGMPIWGNADSRKDEELALLTERIAAFCRFGSLDGSPSSLSSERRPDIRLSLEPWLRLAPPGSPFPDRLLHGKPLEDQDQPFRILQEFLTTCIDAGITVEVHARQPQPGDLLATVDDFWILYLTSLVFDAEGLGPLSWLVQETVESLRSEKGDPCSRASRLWTHVCHRYNDFRSEQYRSKLVEDVCRVALESAKRNTDFLHRFFSFFYICLESDQQSTRRIAEQLNHYDEQLGNDAPPAFLERLKRLTGIGIARATHGIGDIPPFCPRLVEVSDSHLCDYSFEAMVTPITVYDYSSLRGVPPKKLGDNPLEPYVFRVMSERGENLFNLLASEMDALVNLCRLREHDNGLEWDVPTAVEWLTLSGCEDQPYPWGEALPTPERANIDFGSPSKLRPVGTRPLGASRYGALDCCGNVHEIIRFTTGHQFPQDFRLAGGCFQTNIRASSCQVFRAFKERQNDNRRNVGLRLIRYLKKDVVKRWQGLERFMNVLERKSMNCED